jgi:CBS domain-containing protein
MSIANICRREIVTIDAGASLRSAAILMREHHVGALVVTVEQDGRQQAVGIVTDRDLAVEILTRELDPHQVQVAQVASRHLASVPSSADLAEAVAAMRDAGVRRLLVTEHEGQLVGFLSVDDLFEALAAQLGGLALALRKGIAREGVERGAIAPPPPRPVFLAHGTPGMQRPVNA